MRIDELTLMMQAVDGQGQLQTLSVDGALARNGNMVGILVNNKTQLRLIVTLISATANRGRWPHDTP